MNDASPERVLGRFLEARTEKSAPAKVEPYFKKVKKQNPSYSDSQAWATAWSIYCKYKRPGDSSCHQDEYFSGRSKTASPRYDKRRMSVLFVADTVISPAVVREIGREYVTIQNLEPYEEADVSLRVLKVEGSSELASDGQLRETRVDLEYPVGDGDSVADMASLVRHILSGIASKHGARVEPCASGYHPVAR